MIQLASDTHITSLYDIPATGPSGAGRLIFPYWRRFFVCILSVTCFTFYTKLHYYIPQMATKNNVMIYDYMLQAHVEGGVGRGALTLLEFKEKEKSYSKGNHNTHIF